MSINMAPNNSKAGPRIGIIGAGFSGICAAIQLEKQLGNFGFNFTIFDENEDFGGTWLVNKYPGCACDILSHLYSFSFEPNSNWSQNYPPALEIWAYIVRTAKKYDLCRRARFSTQVQTAEWIEADGQWKITVYDKKTKETQVLLFDYMIFAVGGLRVPFVPQEFLGFKGKIIHSAEWDLSYNLEDKRVGVIGSGASAIQIIPAIASKVKELHSYQRRPAWLIPRRNLKIPKFVQQIFTLLPILMWFFRALIFLFNDIHQRIFISGSVMSYLGKQIAKRHLRNQIPGDPSLIKKLTPDYEFGCKRILVASDYFPAFTLPQVHLHREKIEKVEGNTIKTVGNPPQELDVLILATGFQVQDFFSPLQVTGRDGVNLLEKWKAESPHAYFGIMSNSCPNAFFLLGPNTNLGHSSVLFMMECQVSFVIQVIEETFARNAKSVVVKKSAQDEYTSSIFDDLKKTIWESDSCASWYTDERGHVTVLWPHNCISYWQRTRKMNPSLFQFNY